MRQKVESTPKVKAPTLLESVSRNAVQEVTHYSTAEISRRRKVLLVKSSTIEEEISELTFRLSDAKARLKVNQARLQGLDEVVEKR